MIDIKTASAEELEARKAEIGSEADTKEGEELRALSTELDNITAELESRAAQAKADAEERARIAAGAGTTIETHKIEERKEMTNEEIRNSQAYVEAYANGIKLGDMTEARGLLTDNATSGTVPVPTFVSDIVRRAWNKSGVMAKVKKVFLKGNVKFGFEITGGDAVIHTEGGTAVNEQTLTEGIVTVNPESIKAWISISDEVMDLRGEAFLTYIYEELTYRIACKAAATLLGKITGAPTASTTTQVGVAAITATTISVDLVAKAIGKLCDAATEPCVIMNRQTWAAFKEAQYANKYNVDPFEGLEVVFDSSLSTFDAATTGVTYAIVGDLAAGAVAVLPKGEEIEFKVDDKTDMAKDLIKVLGREYIGTGIVGPGCFVSIKH